MARLRRGCAVLVGAALAVACGAKASESSDGEGSGSGGTGDSGSESVSAASHDETGPGSGLTHGIIQLELHRGESQTVDPFIGTATIIATMEYLECLSAFYDANPALRQEGPDGAAIFGGAALGGEGWSDRLCAPIIDAQIDCEILEIRQQLDVVKQLTVTYSVSGVAEGGRLAFGPLPTIDTAACSGGELPLIRVGSNGAVKGTAADDSDLWETEAFSPAEAVTDQGAPIRIAAALAN